MALCEETMCHAAKSVIEKILELMFYSDVKLSVKRAKKKIKIKSF
jgi:hypothetical protein